MADHARPVETLTRRMKAGCRDTRTLSEMKFPVWSRSLSCQGTAKASLGCVNLPVVCAGALIRPGDVVVGDDDGVVAVSREQAAAIAQASEQRVTKENATRETLAKGESGLDIYGWRDKLTALRLEYRK